MKHTAAPLTRGRRLAIRVVGAIGVLLLAFFSIVALNVLGVVASGTEGAPDDLLHRWKLATGRRIPVKPSTRWEPSRSW